MNILVTYQSKTGFTKKYAEWISGELSCNFKELSQVNAAEVGGYELVIHGGWIMGGMINGLEKIKAMNPKKLIVFGVGFTVKTEVKPQSLIEANKLEDIPFFYYEGGMNPDKMGFMGRMMVKMVTKKKPEYTDNTNRDEIGELVEKANSMI